MIRFSLEPNPSQPLYLTQTQLLSLSLKLNYCSASWYSSHSIHIEGGGHALKYNVVCTEDTSLSAVHIHLRRVHFSL